MTSINRTWSQPSRQVVGHPSPTITGCDLVGTNNYKATYGLQERAGSGRQASALVSSGSGKAPSRKNSPNWRPFKAPFLLLRVTGVIKSITHE
jgi:hypothetical protein